MEVLDKYNQVQDFVSSAISTASSKKETILKQFVNVLLLFIILLVFGCLDFATLTFHMEYITTASYWGTVGTKVVAGVCAYNIGINMLWDAELKKDKILNDLIEKYNKLIKYKQIDFEYYVVKIFNVEEKTKAYISQINKKIYWLNKFSRNKDRLLYSSDLPESQKLKEKNLYCKKRQELENLKNPDFIKKNLDNLKVKYYEVDPAVFELEIDGAAVIRGIRTKGNVNAGRVKASASMVMGMVIISMFLTAFGLEADKQEFESQMVKFWHYCMKAIEDTAVVLWQFTRGTFQCRKIISSQLTAPYSGRCQVLTKYIDWRLNNNIPNTKVHEELNKEEEVIEITEEELNKLKEV